jgi:hypothetical protein
MKLRWLVTEYGYLLQYSTIELDDKNNSREVWCDVPKVIEDSEMETARKVMQEDKKALGRLAK